MERDASPPNRCPECGFSWSVPIDEAIALVEASPERFTALIARASAGPVTTPSETWSPTGYLWHVVDVLRFGTERSWTLVSDPEVGVPGWDADTMAAARSYERLSPRVGLRALGRAARDWVDAARVVPLDARVSHPALGTIDGATSIRRNAHEVHHHAFDIDRQLGERSRA